MIYIVARIIMFCTFIYIGAELSGKDLNKKKCILIYAVLLSIINYDTNLSPNISTIISIISTVLAYYIFLNLRKSDLAFYTIVLWLIIIGMDILTMNLVNYSVNRFNIDLELCRFISSLIVTMIFFLLAKLNIFKNFIRKIKNMIYKSNQRLLYWIIIVIVYYLLGSFCLKYMDNNVMTKVILLIACSLISVAVLFLIKQSQIKHLKESVNILTKSNIFYIERIDEYREIKHNLIANIDGIKSVANNEAKILLNDLIKKYNSKFRIPSNFKQVPAGINSIIFEKIYNIPAKKLKVSINNKIKNNIIEVLTAKKYNLFCEALGVTLDNAIEAATKSKEKLLYIEITEEENTIILKIVNTFSGTIDIDALGSKNYTSKNKGHGIGLFSILNSKLVKVTTSIKNNKFYCVLKVTKKES